MHPLHAYKTIMALSQYRHHIHQRTMVSPTTTNGNRFYNFVHVYIVIFNNIIIHKVLHEYISMCGLYNLVTCTCTIFFDSYM